MEYMAVGAVLAAAGLLDAAAAAALQAWARRARKSLLPALVCAGTAVALILAGVLLWLW